MVVVAVAVAVGVAVGVGGVVGVAVGVGDVVAVVVAVAVAVGVAVVVAVGVGGVVGVAVGGVVGVAVGVAVVTPERIAELRALAGAATPGPWGWCGNLTTHEVYLATVKRGRVYVMDFVRWGMTGAAPRFQREHIMERVDKLAVREVPYRGHFSEIDHPDARYIAAACNELPAALDEIDRLRADVERLTRELREAREAIRAYTPRCFVCSRSGTKAWAGQRHRYCDAHADTGHNDVECAPAIRAAEGET